MILYEANEKKFLNNGLGHINDALYCLETKNKSLNGWFVEIELPITYTEVILEGRILFIETKEKKGQPFRISNVEKNSKKIKIIANHIAFDAVDYILVDVRPTDLSPVSFLNWFNTRTDDPSPYITTSNVSGVATEYFIRTTLLEAFVKSQSIFGGVYDIDKFKISLLNKVGNDDGYTLIYGKNIQNAKIIEDWSFVCTKLFPVGPSGLMLPEKYIKSERQYEKLYTKTVTFDFSTSYENENGDKIEYTTEQIIEQLRELANKYITSNIEPLFYYEVNSDINESLQIGDIIRVKHPIFTLKTEVQKYTYDCLSKKVKSIEFGNYSPDVKKVFNDLKNTVNEAITKAEDSLNLSNKQTEIINNINKTGFVYIDDNEILILDKLPKSIAENVWRFGLGGIGFSSNGYKGPFEYALTSDGAFNIDFIKANAITVNKLAADVGSSLDLSSNKSIQLIVEETSEEINKSIENLSVTIEGLTNTLINTGGTNLVRDSIGLFNDKSWLGEFKKGDNIELNKLSIYNSSIQIDSLIHQQINTSIGIYTLSFDYIKNYELANTTVTINDTTYDLSETNITKLKYTFEVNSAIVDIKFNSDTVGALCLTNLMLNQRTESQIWSMNSNETFTDTVKIGRGMEISATGSNVMFSAQADIIGFKNNSNEYIVDFDEDGGNMNELLVRKKATISGTLIQEINNQTTINYIGGK